MKDRYFVYIDDQNMEYPVGLNFVSENEIKTEGYEAEIMYEIFKDETPVDKYKTDKEFEKAFMEIPVEKFLDFAIEVRDGGYKGEWFELGIVDGEIVKL